MRLVTAHLQPGKSWESIPQSWKSAFHAPAVGGATAAECCCYSSVSSRNHPLSARCHNSRRYVKLTARAVVREGYSRRRETVLTPASDVDSWLNIFTSENNAGTHLLTSPVRPDKHFIELPRRTRLLVWKWMCFFPIPGFLKNMISWINFYFFCLRHTVEGWTRLLEQGITGGVQPKVIR